MCCSTCATMSEMCCVYVVSAYDFLCTSFTNSSFVRLFQIVQHGAVQPIVGFLSVSNPELQVIVTTPAKWQQQLEPDIDTTPPPSPPRQVHVVHYKAYAFKPRVETVYEVWKPPSAVTVVCVRLNGAHTHTIADNGALAPICALLRSSSAKV